LFALCLGGAIQLPADGVHAVGFGAYFEYGRAWGTLDRDTASLDPDYDENQFGVGPVIGVNFHLGDRLSVGLDGGYHYMYTVRVDDRSAFDDVLDNGQHLGFVRLTVLLRSKGDRFQTMAASSGAS